MPTNFRTELPQLALIATMFAVAAFAWSVAPDRLPVHWNAAGEVDRYAGKFQGLLLLPLTTLGLYLLFLVLPRIDPGRINYAGFSKVYLVLRYAVLLFFVAFYGLTLFETFVGQVSFLAFVSVLSGILFVVVGNLMGKVRPNWFVGARTPWTLSSKRSWTRTNRLGGRMLVVAGLALVGTGVLDEFWAYILVLGLFVAGVLFLIPYSYVVWRTDPEKQPPSGTRPDDGTQ